jgi:hypothetical protein
MGATIMPTITGEDFRQNAPWLPRACGHGSSPLTVSSTTPPPEEARYIPKHLRSAAISTRQLIWPQHHGDTRLATSTKKEKSSASQNQDTVGHDQAQLGHSRPRHGQGTTSHSQDSANAVG